MADILLGQSFYLRFEPKLLAAMQPCPPPATLYVTSYIRQPNRRRDDFDCTERGSI